MLRASSRYQLLFGPATTPGGAVYQRLPGMPASALETKVWTPGEATNTPSEPYFMKWRVVPRVPPPRPEARGGGEGEGAAALELSLVRGLARARAAFQLRAPLSQKDMQEVLW